MGAEPVVDRQLRSWQEHLARLALVEVTFDERQGLEWLTELDNGVGVAPIGRGDGNTWTQRLDSGAIVKGSLLLGRRTGV